MKLIDANIFLYAVGKQHEHRETSQAVLRRVMNGTLSACTNTEVLQEIMYVCSHRGQFGHATEYPKVILQTFTWVFPIDSDVVLLACQLFSRYPSLQTRDAIHAAVVLQHRLEGIISADRGFDIIEGLTRFDPKELAA